jgi:beta-mannosidase
VLSGGSETEQQPTYLGLDERSLPLQDSVIPEHAERLLPGVPYITSSPTGGDLPTDVGAGVAHYFGVGAYRRPLSDLRTAGVRFAAECLALSVPPETATVDTMPVGAAGAGHHPAWKAGIPRDAGASWDFEDVRDHYVRELFGIDPAGVRAVDPEHYLDLGRAAVAELFRAAVSEWRRPGSGCAGALVLGLRDLVPGAGWGLVDALGRPKAPWYALRDLLAPVALLATDEGLDGIRLHAVNDTAAQVSADLQVRLFTPAGHPAEAATSAVVVPARGGITVPLSRLLGAFRDVNHAHRFGPAGYATVAASLTDSSGTRAQLVHRSTGPAIDREPDVGLRCLAETTPGAPGVWSLSVSSVRAATWVALDVPGFAISDAWFHLAPGTQREVVVTGAADRTPVGTVRALNSVATARIEVTA